MLRRGALFPGRVQMAEPSVQAVTLGWGQAEKRGVPRNFYRPVQRTGPSRLSRSDSPSWPHRMEAVVTDDGARDILKTPQEGAGNRAFG